MLKTNIHEKPLTWYWAAWIEGVQFARLMDLTLDQIAFNKRFLTFLKRRVKT